MDKQTKKEELTMYLRIKASVWHAQYFKGSSQSPSVQSVKKWIDAGKLAGRKLGTMHFVFCDKNHEPLALDDMPDFLTFEASKKGRKINTGSVIVKTGNSIADSIINKKLK